MLKPYVFDGQLFPSDAFALMHDIYLAGNMGIARGCELSNASNSITVSDGFFIIKGRALRIFGGETVNMSPTQSGELYCRLICEIDLNKENTDDECNQAYLKILTSATGFPTLTQQDINYGGKICQFEFAQFKNTVSGISNFEDKRKFLNIESIVAQSVALVSKAMQDVQDGSAFVAKTGGKMTGELEVPSLKLGDNKIRTIYSGTGTPASSVGVDGDIYIKHS